MQRYASVLAFSIVAASLAAPLSAFAATIQVPADRPTIQEAIDAALPGDTISVAAGTYAEHVTVNKPLVLMGANSGIAGNGVRGPESIITGTTTGALQITADNVTIDGFKVMSAKNDLGTGVHVAATQSGASIKDNVITGNQIGIYANSSGTSTISANLFDANNEPGSAGGAGIYSEFTDHMTISDNEFRNHTLNNPLIFAATGANVHKNLVVRDNELHDNVSGIMVLGVNTGTFMDNDVSSTGGTGVSLGGGGNTNVQVTGNNLHNNARGVRFEDLGFGLATDTAITVNRNALTGNTAFGVVNTSGVDGAVDATCNWWGAANGPGPVGTGSGDKVSTNVKFVSWLTSSDLASACNGSPATTTLSAEDFGVVNFDTGLGILKGYSAGFGLSGATFASTSVTSVVMQLFASSTLLQTNTSTAKVGNVVTGTQISSPFDVSGNFDYAADGFWTNVRQAEFGQHLAATRVVASVTLVDGTVLTAENDNPTGDPATIMPNGTLVVTKIALGGVNTFSFTGDNGIGAFQITTATTSATTTSIGSATFNVASSTFHINEATTTGWTLITNGCATVLATANATTTCTVVNAKLGEIKGTKFEDRGNNNNREEDGDDHHGDGNRGHGSLNRGHGDDGDEDEDEDRNDLRPVAGVTIFLDANNNGVLDLGEASTTTDANGNYDFPNLIPGLFHVREVVPAGTVELSPVGGVFDITLSAGQVSAGNDFVNARLGVISGMKFNDLNANGYNDTNMKKGIVEAGLPGWTITVTGPNAFATSTVTDRNGNYSFNNLVPGAYTLSEVMQAGWVQTKRPGNVTVRSGTVSTGNDFGNHLGQAVTSKGKSDGRGGHGRD